MRFFYPLWTRVGNPQALYFLVPPFLREPHPETLSCVRLRVFFAFNAWCEFSKIQFGWVGEKSRRGFSKEVFLESGAENKEHPETACRNFLLEKIGEPQAGNCDQSLRIFRKILGWNLGWRKGPSWDSSVGILPKSWLSWLFYRTSGIRY